VLEKTFFMVKPDGLARNLENEIFSRIENAGLKIVRREVVFMTLDLAADLYSPHLGKPFYEGLIKFITSGPVMCSVLEGEDAIKKVRGLMGATDPRQAVPGTIRGDLKEQNIFTSENSMKNLVHGSDSPEAAEREIKIFFGEGIKYEN